MSDFLIILYILFAYECEPRKLNQLAFYSTLAFYYRHSFADVTYCKNNKICGSGCFRITPLLKVG
ncbi:MAG: hypothetical protein D4R39_04875 [Methylophilaceae bacterium]|nr:MAG: hypothetical protein D4R39_04875 [Methylophilaceae bacterium]